MNFDVELFNKTYRGTRWFSEESKYFTEFLKDIQAAAYRIRIHIQK